MLRDDARDLIKLQFLFQKMLWSMVGLKVDVDVGALNVWQILELDLQLFSDVVGMLQAGFRVHDDVDLDNETRAAVVGSNSINGGDLGGMRHG